jgi:hypothetical protein
MLTEYKQNKGTNEMTQKLAIIVDLVAQGCTLEQAEKQAEAIMYDYAS